MNKILNIEEVYDVKFGWNTFDGFKIETEKDTYYFLIENGQNCCENWGYISSNDEYKEYIGKELVGIDVVDNACNKILNILNEDGIYECDCYFINLKFKSWEELQLAVYNQHNGYYGHNVLFIKNDERVIDSEL